MSTIEARGLFAMVGMVIAIAYFNRGLWHRWR
jgi:hypothetical protein